MDLEGWVMAGEEAIGWQDVSFGQIEEVTYYQLVEREHYFNVIPYDFEQMGRVLGMDILEAELGQPGGQRW